MEHSLTMESTSALPVDTHSLLISTVNYLSLGQFELAKVCLHELGHKAPDLQRTVLEALVKSGMAQMSSQLLLVKRRNFGGLQVNYISTHHIVNNISH